MTILETWIVQLIRKKVFLKSLILLLKPNLDTLKMTFYFHPSIEYQKVDIIVTYYLNDS